MNTKTKEWLKTIGTGLIGAVVGIITTSYMNIYTYQKQQQYELALKSVKFDSMDKPVEYIDLKLLMDEITNLSVMDSDSIEEGANLLRQYPQCASTLSDECRAFMVKSILIMRKELGTGKVSEKDIDTILKPKYQKAERAMKVLQNQ
ncbi:MAG: hypothetical protein WBL28_01695 [Methylotenera sp.]